MTAFDLLVQHGEVVDPTSGQRAQLDVGIAQGKIVALEPTLAATPGCQVLDASGKLVTPGLIDLHTHLGFELHTHVIQPEDVCPSGGVTAAVDMGSTGAFTFPWYRERVLQRPGVKLFEFLNIASLGTIAIHTPYYVEHYGDYIDVDETIRTIEANRAWIRGIKVFTSSAMVGDSALKALRAARRVADVVGLPVAAHISDAPPALESVLSFLGAGDILTHSFTGHDQGILDAQGQLKPAVVEARERGVLFDIGHGAGSLSFAVARRALDQGFVPDTISTDLYYANVETPVINLPTTLSKFLNLGMPLEQVLACATCQAARALREPSLGALYVGAPAQITVLALEEGEFPFRDSLGQPLTGAWRLTAEATICDGQIIYQRGAA